MQTRILQVVYEKLCVVSLYRLLYVWYTCLSLNVHGFYVSINKTRVMTMTEELFEQWEKINNDCGKAITFQISPNL